MDKRTPLKWPSPIERACAKAIRERSHAPVLRILRKSPELKVIADYFEEHSTPKPARGRPIDREHRTDMYIHEMGLKAYKEKQRALGRRVKHDDALEEFLRLWYPKADASELADRFKALELHVRRPKSLKKVPQ